MKLNHLHIAVPNVEEALQFYQSFFEMKLSIEHGDGVFLTDDAGFLLAIDPLGKDETIDLPPWHHFGFCVDSAETVRKIYDRMKAAGVEFAREYREFGCEAANFYCWSPGPLKLEVSWNKEDEPPAHSVATTAL